MPKRTFGAPAAGPKPPALGIEKIPSGSRSVRKDLVDQVLEEADPLDRRDSATKERADHRDPRVLPVAAALAGDRQDGMHDPRPKVAGGVDRVPGRTSEREADHDDKQGNGQRAERRHVLTEAEDHEDQDERPDDLRNQVPERAADRRAGVEDGELQAL